ncbi:MAG: hypothetical protein CNE95_02110 [Puniceicoccaceae bacterium MED-G30]|jgi:hypothetical protein|nr:MAG: hypothetical protein CNE95_02110 [Puniceicoccaceae bacterium MED-G30]RPG86360.1 MAG: hypothetical protein CBC33_002465 [Coraliomargarita sp. TMED73]|tara:strand:- start:4243 stop:4866 length:624 start_codon:yes stop_codon:yes gene_type:complete
MFWQIIPALLLLACVIGLYWWLLQQSSVRIYRQYQSIAKQFELELTAPDAALAGFVRPEPFVHGHYQGREISISAPGKGLQNTRQTETVLKIAVADTGLRMQIAKSGLVGRLGQRDRGEKKRWLSGDVEFDRALDVRSNDGVRLAMLLSLEMQQKMRALLESSGATLYLGGSVLALARPGLLGDEAGSKFFKEAVDVLCHLADLLDA